MTERIPIELRTAALEELLVAKVLVADGAVDERAADMAARPAGWDHQHEGHDHDH